MLNRRFLRIKTMQALYAFLQSKENNLGKAEKELFLSIERVYDLYLHLLLLPIELSWVAEEKIAENKKKELPTQEDLQPNMRFVENRLIGMLKNSEEMMDMAKRRNISWSADQEVIQKFFKALRDSDEYQDYMTSAEDSFEQDRDFLVLIFRNLVSHHDMFAHIFQERSIYWDFEDFDYAIFMVVNSYKKLKSSAAIDPSHFPLYKDEKDDVDFVRQLFRKTVSNNKKFEAMVDAKTQNWDLDRIALLDIILMKMAITEFTEFGQIPVKVSLNEYIDISKSFSSPKSSLFINGILDKIIADLKEENKIKKIGRGLIE